MRNKHSYPPIPIPGGTPTHPSPHPVHPTKKKRGALKTLYSILYHTTFYFFIIFIACLLAGSAYGLGSQAIRTGGQRRWNLFVLAAAYIVLGFVSIAHVWSRILSVRKILRSMPRPYMPTKQMDLPKKVANHIMVEYSRTAVIAHISQATTGQQEGWGRPNSKWENQHFRTSILSTLPTMRTALIGSSSPSSYSSSASPISLQPLIDAAEKVDQGPLRVLVKSYCKIIERAQFARQEPTEEDAAACEKIVEVVLLTLQVKRQRVQREGAEKPISARDFA